MSLMLHVTKCPAEMCH